jgi:3-mercaptopyruvate sulfurtransferase SseA
MILEGGFRGWEAHDLPIQKMETMLSQKACDELAVKIGKDVSKLTG